MLAKQIKPILIVTGVITLLPLLQFLAPQLYLTMNKVTVTEPAGLFFLRHWGVAIFCFGVLLIQAARDPAIRKSVMLAALVSKSAIVYLLLREWGNPAFEGMRAMLAFDALCVLLYAAYLATNWGQEKA